MLPIEAISKITATLETGARNENYSRTIEVRKFATMIVTGKGQEEVIMKYRRNESKALQKQRVRVTNSLTKYALARPRKYWKKVARVEGVKEEVRATDTDGALRIKNQFSNFNDGYTLREWLTMKLEFLGVTDPNAWIVYERNDTRDLEGNIVETLIYPWVVGCENVLDYKYEFGRLLWVLCREPKMDKTAQGADRWLYDYYLYAPGYVVRIREKGETISTEPMPNEEAVSVVQKDQTAASVFYVAVIENGTTEVPAAPCGCYLDEETLQQSFVTWFDPATDVFQDLIRDKSFLDVTKTVHTFPRRWEYVKTCKYKDASTGKECSNGFLNGNFEHRCPACSGSGLAPSHTTEQQVLQLAMPKNGTASDLLELSKLSFMEQMPIDLPKWLDDQVQKAEERVMDAIFNAGVVERATGAATATEKNYEYEDIYDVIRPFADLIARHMELAYRVAGQYMNVEGFTVSFRFPKDFKMKSLDELITEFERARTAGVGYETLKNLRRQIIEKQNENDPDTIAKVLARYEWLPFDDKNDEEATMILTARSPQDDQRVLRENWLEIFTEIEVEQLDPPFYALARDKQSKIIKTKVEQFKSRILLAGELLNTPPEQITE